MIYTIENDLLKIDVNECGAELCSIYSKKRKREYIWQQDPEVWANAAPVLFPFIGNLKGGEFSYEGQKYKIPKHGFVRHNDQMKLVSQSAHRLSFLLKSNEETLAMYPFKFELKISFSLLENKLQVFHEIVNKNEGPMLFSIGAHPALKVPWKEGENRDDYFLEFEHKEESTIFGLSDNGLLLHTEKPGLDKTNKLVLEDGLFDDDALIYTDLNSSLISLKSKTSKGKVSVNFDDFPFLGIWSKPNANFVCIEPWDGLPDFETSDQELLKKTGIIKLREGNVHYASYTIQIFE